MNPTFRKQFPGGRPLAACLLLAAALAAPLRGQEPEWWAEFGVLSGTPQDTSPVNVGQIKYFATKAKDAMDANLPGGAGQDIDDLISDWQAATAPNNYAATTLGQLKHVGKLFHDRLAEEGLAEPGEYPWTGVLAAEDFALAAIGQAKTTFAFELGLPITADFHLYRILGDDTITVAQDVPVLVTTSSAETVEYEVLVQPKYGTLDETNAPAYTYQPGPGFTGADFFVYKARLQGSGAESNAAQVSLLVAEYPNQIELVHPVDNKHIVEGDGVTFVVDAFRAGTAVTSVEFYADDVKIGSATTDTLDAFTWLNPSVGTHEVKAIAYFDDATSATSGTHTIVIDPNSPPAISLALVPDPEGASAPVLGNTISVEAEASDSDAGDKVKRVQFFLDGQLIGEDFTPDADVFQFTLPDDIWGGTHTVMARAVDAHGKTAEDQETFNVTGNHAPVVSISSPAPRAEFQASPGELGTADIPVEIQASDADAGDGLASVEVEVTTGLATTTHAATLDGSVYRVTLEDLSPGTYFLRAKATDNSNGAAGHSAVVKCLVIAEGQVPPSELLAEITGSNITTANLDFIGNLSAATKYKGGRSYSIESNSGILLTSGTVTWKGPNDDDGTSAPLGEPGDDDLDLLVVDDLGQLLTNDAAGLEFDFTPTKSKLEVVLQFASEEYSEFSPGGSQANDFNDLFAMYVDGVNIARVPGSRDIPESVHSKIGVDSINSLEEVPGALNPGSNRHLYCDNDDDDDTDPGPEIHFKTEYDGFTFKVTAMAAVTPNQTHHMKIVIADAVDFLLDSGLFIKSASFRSVDP